MTIADLKQYRSICAEIKDIESELDGSYAGDTVQSGSKFPYSCIGRDRSTRLLYIT